MKKLLFSLALTFLAATSFGQWMWEINFEDTATLHRVVINSALNPHNVWQIGHPSKTLFHSANSNPNAIVTDTANPYPVNDTSSFTIIHIAEMGWTSGYPKVDIGGWYSVNSDTLTDYGYIEFSANHGNTWYRVDNYEGYCTWGAVEDLPTFTGNSNGWKHFYYCLQVPVTVNYGDTILYRFTFISDGVQTNKDGLMFDDLHFEDWAEGIHEIQNNEMISISPNPVSDELRVQRNQVTGHPEIKVVNFLGQVVYNNPDFTGETIDTRQFRNGIYILNYSFSNYFAIKKFVVNHQE